MRRHHLIFMAMVVTLVTGCVKPLEPIFPPLAKPLLWPTPPEPTRVKYVGQLVTSADLKPRVGLGEAIGGALFGKKPALSMLSPYAVCTDGANRVFVADSNAQLVHVFDLKTRKYERWVPKNPEKRFAQPVGVAYDPAGRLFVADSVAQKIYVFDARGNQTGEFGAGLLTRPAGLAYDAPRQRLYVADPGAHQVIILAGQGGLQARLGGRGTLLGQFNFPTNVAVDSQGRLYVSDSLNFRIQQFGADFRPIRQIGRSGDMPGYFGQPKGLAVDSQDHLYVVDAQFEAVQIFDSAGSLLLDFGVEGHGPGEFWLPAGIYIDKSNRIWVADTYNRRVQVFDYVPEVTR